MRRNHRPGLIGFGRLLRRFVVVEESMRPALLPGDGLLAMRCGKLRAGQIRVFPDPLLSTRYLVKRVGGIRHTTTGAVFEALSDNAGAPGATDSREFGWVPAAGSYRVVWKVRKVRKVRTVRARGEPGEAAR